MILSRLKNDNELLKKYLTEKQEQGYSKADISREIFEATTEAGEETTFEAVRSYIKRETSKLDLIFVDGNKSRTKRNDTETKSDTKELPEHNSEKNQKEVGIIDKLDRILDLLENSNQADIKSNTEVLEISSDAISKDEIFQASVKLNKNVWKQFNNFCNDGNLKKYKKQDLLSQALLEFMEKYK